MTLYEALASTRDGRRGLAAARLRYRVKGLLHRALASSGMSQSDVAKALGLGKSAVSQVFSCSGNLRVNTVAEYLDAMGFEVNLELVPAGTARKKAVQLRSIPVTKATPSVVDMYADAWRTIGPMMVGTGSFGYEPVSQDAVEFSRVAS